jgi:hypothetical protein
MVGDPQGFEAVGRGPRCPGFGVFAGDDAPGRKPGLGRAGTELRCFPFDASPSGQARGRLNSLLAGIDPP